MQITPMSDQALGELYSLMILPLFEGEFKHVSWMSFRWTVGPDNDLHIFRDGERWFVLLFEDYPTVSTKDVADRIEINVSDLKRIHPKNSAKAEVYFYLEVQSPYIHNVTGYFQLFEVVKPSAKLTKLRKYKRTKQSRIALSLASIGHEIIDLERGGLSNRESLARIAENCWFLAEAEGLHEFEHWFYDFAEFSDIYDSYEGTEIGSADQLDKIVKSFGITPTTTAQQQEALNKKILPIHEKMVSNPERANGYFVEMVNALDELITQEELSIPPAVQELLYTVDRPAIQTDKKLLDAIALLYEIPAPGEQSVNNDRELWRKFIKIVNKNSKRPAL